MNLKKSITSILILAGVLFSLSFPGISAESRQSEDAKSIVALVSSAAALIENKGKDSFA